MGAIQQFKEFATRGNLVDMAVGFTVGAAFTTIARSLVDDIIMPAVGLVVGNREFEDLFYVLKSGTANDPPYKTLAAAQEAGAVTINYGVFVNNILIFFIVALVMFLLIRGIQRLENVIEDELGIDSDKDAPKTKKCPYCISTISRKATRCPECTSQLDGELVN
jgi:large conductance mechanosensitive channel